MRPNSYRKLGISLFPMFSLMVAVLGILLFILVTVVLFAVGVDKTVRVEVQASARTDAHQRQPVFLEWDGQTLIAHPWQYELAIERDLDLDFFDVRNGMDYLALYKYLDGKLANTPMAQVFYDVAQDKENKYFVVLVRPSGLKSFTELRGYIEQRGIALGYEPVDADWKIRIKEARHAPPADA